MPDYPYSCPKCGKNQIKFKSMKAIDDLEHCSECNTAMDKCCRKIETIATLLYTKVEDSEFNHGLGCVTHSRRHRKEIAKELGLEEVGNDEAPAKSFDREDKYWDNRTKTSYKNIFEDKICLSK